MADTQVGENTYEFLATASALRPMDQVGANGISVLNGLDEFTML